MTIPCGGRFVRGIPECSDCTSGYKTPFGYCTKKSCVVFTLHHPELKGIKYPGRMYQINSKGGNTDENLSSE